MTNISHSSNRRLFTSPRIALFAVACAVAGCSDASITNYVGSGGNSPGGQSSAGGASSTGGATDVVGSTGGTSTVNTNVNPNTGGSAAGGQNTGGAATGGKAAGGAATGGAATGGKAAGGAATGGAATGGKAAGGAATGGAATGGKAAGGAATGGAATGGAATGGSTSSSAAIGGTHSGEATYYDYNNNGACGFTNTINSRDFAAMNSSDYGMATWCGACVDVTGPNGTVKQVLIVDECPTCAAGDLDFKPATFDKIATHSAGRAKITWNIVACDVSGAVQYKYKDGSNSTWTALLIINSRLPISKLEYSTDNGSTWKSMNRERYNYFVTTSGFGSGSVMVRLTASNGQTITDTLTPVAANTTVTGTKNF